MSGGPDVSSFIIGTAGHIDHGKTSLVKALTGVETDRLKEERERGISIDLGFAHLDLPGGLTAGVIDVPGHERFIRNMLAGAHGIDLVLFTVAADDGVMPQTEEHLDILHVLGVEQAIFVITKIDLADAARVREVAEEIEILSDGTAFEHSSIVRFSAITGEGLDELRSRIVDMLSTRRARRADGYFRMPVDRAFHLQGHGLVVTGTAISGAVTPGEHVRALPGDGSFRVRTIQVHDHQVAVATQGQRVALNVSGTGKTTVERGDAICHERLTRVTERFDAFLQVRLSVSATVENHQRVRVHVGTAERMGRVVVLGTEETLATRESAYCQIVLDHPIHALRGDRFVIRDETAQRTLGGGVVVQPWARKHRRREPDLQQRLRTLHLGDVPEAAEAFIADASEFAVPFDDLVQLFNLRDDLLAARLDGLASLVIMNLEAMRFVTTAQRAAKFQADVLAALGTHHAGHPLASGMDIEEARLRLRWRIAPRLFRHLIERLESAGVLVREDHYVRMPGHRIRIEASDQALIDAVAAILSQGTVTPADIKDLETQTGTARGELIELLAVMERQGTIVRIGSEIYALRRSIEEMARMVREFFVRNDVLTPAAFRDLFGTSRKYAIPLLEYLDREGVTVRAGEGRTLRSHHRT